MSVVLGVCIAHTIREIDNMNTIFKTLMWCLPFIVLVHLSIWFNLDNDTPDLGRTFSDSQYQCAYLLYDHTNGQNMLHIKAKMICLTHVASVQC